MGYIWKLPVNESQLEMARRAAEYEERFEQIENDIASETSLRISEDTAIINQLQEETLARYNADTLLTAQIDSETLARYNADTLLTKNLNDEVTLRAAQINSETLARYNADTLLTKNLNDEVTLRAAQISNETLARYNADTLLTKNLNDEVTLRAAQINSETLTRYNADTLLTKNLNDEVTLRAAQISNESLARYNADTLLTKNLNDEVTLRAAQISNESLARYNADTLLTKNLNDEVTLRANQTSALQTSLATEQNARATADTNLQTSLAAEQTARYNADTLLTANKLDATANAVSSSKLQNARSLKVSLSNANAVNFDGSANVTTIGVGGILPVANGGTGQNNLASITVGGATRDGSGNNIVNTYVTKVNGKGLSTNDFTNDYKTKLDGIAASANNYSLPDATTTTKGGVKIGSNISVNSGVISVTKDNVTNALGYTPVSVNTTYSNATTTTSGLMSADDKKKLNGIAASANNYSLPDATTTTKGGVKIGSNISVNGGTISVTKDNVTNALGYTPVSVNTTYSNATTTTSGLMSADDKKKLNGIAASANNYSLPDATTTTKGGVKIGSNISVNSGTISIVKDNVTNALGYTPVSVNTTYSNATTTTSGLMSADDKKKLNGIAASANNYSLPDATTTTKGGVKIGSNISVNGGTISVTKDNVTNALGYTPVSVNTTYSNATTTTSGLMSADDKKKLNGIAASAQVNVIESVKVNNTALTVSNKAVNIDLSGYLTTNTANNTYITKSEATTIIGGSSDKLSTARKLKVSLSSSAAVDFDGSANVTTIGVGGILPVANGGTGNSLGAMDKAAKDADGNVISDSYLKLTGGNVNGTVTANAFKGAGVHYFGTCTTGATVVDKVVTCAGFKLATGAIISVNFSNNVQTPDITLNVNGTGAYPVSITYNATTEYLALYDSNSKVSAQSIQKNQPVTFIFTGSAWFLCRGDALSTENANGITRYSHTAANNYLQLGRGSDPIYYGYSTTAASTVAKVVYCPEVDSDTLKTDFFIMVKFDNTSTAANPTLNVNDTGAFPIKGVGNSAAANSTYFNKYVAFVFKWKALLKAYVLVRAHLYDARMTWYVTSDTAANTAAKVVDLDTNTQNRSYTGRAGERVVLNLTVANTASNPTLNINRMGAKAIYKGATRLTGAALKAGIYDLVNDGTNWQVVSMPADNYVSLGTSSVAAEGAMWISWS